MRKTTRSILAAMTAAAVAAGSMSMAFASEAESTWEKKEYTGAVSYTHLDVYKRQDQRLEKIGLKR